RTRNSGAHSEAESDTSPGALLSTGYIAGGTLAGVLIAFLNFSQEIPKKLSVWQYSRYTVTQEQPLEELYKEAAKSELGLSGQAVPSDDEKDVKSLADDIADLNSDLIPQ